MAHHVECGVWLISRDHVSSSVDQHKPEVSWSFRPSTNFPINCPDLLRCPLPLRNSFPIQAVEILKNAWSVNNKIILPVIDKNFDVSECQNDIRSITSGDINSKGGVNIIVSWNVLDTCSELGLVGFKEFRERLIFSVVVSEIEGTNSSEVFLWSRIVIGNEIEVGSSIGIFSIVNVDDGVGLEPSQDISEFTINASNWPEIWIIEVHLVDWVSPSISNSDPLQFDTSISLESFVLDDSVCKGWNIVSAEGFSSNV